MNWGVNIHHRAAGSYAAIAVAAQMALAKHIGFSRVRVEVYDGSAATLAWLAPLCAAAQTAGLKVIIVFAEPNAAYISTENSCYFWCYQQARALAMGLTAHHSVIEGYEAGNELDLKCKKPETLGTKSADFDTALFPIARGAIRGWMNGFKSVTPAAVAINTTDNNFGFFDRLKSTPNPVITGGFPDALSWHRYVPPGAPMSEIEIGAEAELTKLKSYGKPVIITEFGQDDGHLATDSPQTMLDMMTAIESRAASKGVHSAYIYELFDIDIPEPEVPLSEQKYGLADKLGVLNALGQAVKARLNP